MIRVFLFSNFRLLLDGIEALLSQENERFHVVGKAEQLEGLTKAVASVLPDVLVLDIDTAPMEILAQIAELNMIDHRMIRVLLLTRLSNKNLQDEAMIAGARGIIDSSVSPDLFLNAVEKVHEGQIWLNRYHTGQLWSELTCLHDRKTRDPSALVLERLSEREKKILRMVVHHSDLSAKRLSEHLHISESTLRNHLTAIYKKCGVPNRSGLLAYSLQNRLAERIGSTPPPGSVKIPGVFS